MSFLVEMVVDGRMDGGEFLQTSHLPKPEHGSLSSSKWKVRILRLIVQPATRFLPVRVADDFHCGAIGTQFVRHDDVRFAVALH